MATTSSGPPETISDYGQPAIHSDSEGEPRRILSLVQYCQRVAVLHVERMDSIEGLRLDLVKPMLERCSPETLLRLEQASPELSNVTSDVWKSLCFQTYALAAQSLCIKEEPESWRESYFIIRERETKRLEDLGMRLRTQREEAELRKKEGQVKFTDRLPLPKRRGWGTPAPKTLFQKTRSDAAKMTKGIYGKQRLPPMPVAKVLRVLPENAKLLPSPPSRSSSTSSATSGSRVTVTAVTVRRKSTVAPKPETAISQPHQSVVTHSQAGLEAKRLRISYESGPLRIAQPSFQESAVPLKPPLPKKDPKASLFMPKHRAFSQLSSAPGVRSRS